MLGGSLSVAQDVIVVVLDDSGSMKESMKTDRGKMSRMEAAKQALSLVVDQLPSDTQLGILLLNGGKANDHWILPISKLEPASAKAKIESIRANGGTPLGGAMKSAMNELLQLRSKQVYGRYRLLVVTDGEATDADYLSKHFADMISRGITLDVIGVAMRDDHSLSHRAHSYRRASDAESFKQAVQEVFAEASDQGQEVDFSLLEAFPDEMAREVISALTTNNVPIGTPAPKPVLPREQPQAGDQGQPSPEADPAAQPATNPVPDNFGAPPQRKSSFGRILGTICCLGFFFILFFLGSLGANAKRKR